MKTYQLRDAIWLGRPYWSPTKDKGTGNVLPHEGIVISDARSKYVDESDDDDDNIPAITGIVDFEDEEDEQDDDDEIKTKVTTQSG